ncbi:hypothetical protein AD928_06340 [Acetobacter cerevisiae]|uniref:Hedgehog/Intein (Hint) domain-containing protein n=1 Tax=Acetobacter cerevisiae TaxID=178900 RepID=A0A149QCM1_9PROT|nr:hypothetical protein AD928_06340 [Acetobacter cerevisiae]
MVTSYAVKITDPDGNVTNLGNVGTGQVLTKDGGALSIISILGLGGGTYVVPPGVTGSVNTVLSALSGVTVYVGGTATINTDISALSGVTVNVDGGTATLGSNVVLGALSGSTINLTNGGTFSNGGGLIGLLTGSTINFGTGGGNFIANAGGALLDLSSTTIKGFDTAKDFISFENLAAAPATYSIANSSGSQVITVFDANNKKIADVTVSGQNFATGNYSSSGIGPLTVSSDGTSLSIEAVGSVCFLSGTLLRTPDGDVAIEEVQIGDSLLAFENGKPVAQPVVWVGSRRAEVRPGLPLDEAGWPVRVRQDALAEGVPSKDLLITPEHCLYLDGQFVPARMLVNGETIAYDQTICTYTYYHVETAQHAVIMADGTLTESYLDTGNRRAFRQAGTVVRIPGLARCWAEDAAAPLMTAREAVEPLHRRLAQRAETLRTAQSEVSGVERDEAELLPDAATLTTDPDLHLVTEDGAVLRKARTHNGCVVFMVPPHVRAVRLVSRASRPVDTIGPFVDDRRMLGVLVGRMMVQEGAAEARALEPAVGTLAGSGWHAAEAGQAARWTNGHAALALGARQPGALGLLSIEVLAGGPYRVNAQSAALPRAVS